MRTTVGPTGFVLIPHSWPVERTFAWLTAHRRLVRYYERGPGGSEHMIRWAAINGTGGGLTGAGSQSPTRRTLDWSLNCR